MSSNTVETTTTPVEVNTNGVLNTSIPQVFRLKSKPVFGPNKKDNQPKLFQTQYPLYKQQLESLGYEFQYLGEDIPLSSISALAKTRTETVNVVVRTKVFDYLGVSGKKQTFEAFVYYKTIEGWSKTGESLGAAYVSVGLDYQVPVTQKYDEDENPLPPEIGRKFEVHTIPWSVEAFDKVMEGQDALGKMQYIVNNGNASYSGFSYEEFRNLPFAELEIRASSGFINQPVDFLVSELSAKERFALYKK